MWGLALGAHKPAKISQHEVNFSFYRPIAACGLGGDREALEISKHRRSQKNMTPHPYQNQSRGRFSIIAYNCVDYHLASSPKQACPGINGRMLVNTCAYIYIYI